MMRVNGLNEFLYRFVARPSQNAARAASSLSLKRETDILDLSEAGKRLRFHSGESAAANKANPKTKAALADPALRLMDKSMTRVSELLERMKSLTVAA
jgi:hypothetical protein